MKANHLMLLQTLLHLRFMVILPLCRLLRLRGALKLNLWISQHGVMATLPQWIPKTLVIYLQVCRPGYIATAGY